jgi:hypothetical protein
VRHPPKNNHPCRGAFPVSRYEFDGFLKEHRIEKYTAQDFDHDLATIREFAGIQDKSLYGRVIVPRTIAAKLSDAGAPALAEAHRRQPLHFETAVERLRRTAGAKGD